MTKLTIHSLGHVAPYICTPKDGSWFVCCHTCSNWWLMFTIASICACRIPRSRSQVGLRQPVYTGVIHSTCLLTETCQTLEGCARLIMFIKNCLWAITIWWPMLLLHTPSFHPFIMLFIDCCQPAWMRYKMLELKLTLPIITFVLTITPIVWWQDEAPVVSPRKQARGVLSANFIVDSHS